MLARNGLEHYGNYFRSKNRSQRRASGRRPKSVGESKVDQANKKLREENLG